MNARSVVWIFILTVFLSGCAATLPKEIETTDVSAIKLGQVREEPSAYAGTKVRWGGQVIAVENRKDHSRITILSRPLMSGGRPDTDRASDGRFIAQIPGFIDPAEYAADSSITVVGRISGEVKETVGEYPYLYPKLSVEGHVLWPPLPEREVIYYDPWPGPWYGPMWYRHPYWW